jgi:hypothetical protein
MFFRILRDPNTGGAAGAGGAGGNTATEGAKVVIEGDVSKGISNWTDVFPEADRSNPVFSKYKTPSDLVKGIGEMNELIGRKGVILPTKDSKPEEVAAFYNAIGRPEKPEGYTFNKVENLHKAISITPEAENGWRTVAHQIGLTQAQADALNQWWLKVNDAAVRQLEANSLKASQDAETTLRSAWKDKFDVNKAAAQKAMQFFGGKEMLQKLGPLANDPSVLAMFYNVGSKITMDGDGFPSFPSGNQGGGGGEFGKYGSLDAAKSRLQEINTAGSDANKALFDEKHKDHDAIVEERTKLYQMVYPG